MKLKILFLVYLCTVSLICLSQQSTEPQKKPNKKIVDERPVQNSGEVDIKVYPSRSKDVYTYAFTNKTESIIDICYYFKRKNGHWSDNRGINAVKPGQEVKGDGYDATETVVVFVRRTGSSYGCPSSSEIKK